MKNYKRYSNWSLNNNKSAILILLLIVPFYLLIGFWGIGLAWIIHYLTWKLYIKPKKKKSKAEENKENEIASYLIIFFAGFFIWILLGWIFATLWYIVGFTLANRYMKKLK